MGSQDPIAVCLFARLPNLDAPLHVPHAQSAIFRIGKENVHAGVEKNARNISVVALQGIHFPVLIAG